MRVHGRIELIGGILALIGAAVSLIVFFVTEEGLLWISIGSCLVSGIIAICLGGTFEADAYRLDRLEARVAELESGQSTVKKEIEENKITVPNRTSTVSKTITKKDCPMCNATLKMDADVCFNCGYELPKTKVNNTQAHESSGKVRCPNCGELNEKFRTNCYMCDAKLKD